MEENYCDSDGSESWTIVDQNECCDPNSDNIEDNIVRHCLQPGISLDLKDIDTEVLKRELVSLEAANAVSDDEDSISIISDSDERMSLSPIPSFESRSVTPNTDTNILSDLEDNVFPANTPLDTKTSDMIAAHVLKIRNKHIKQNDQKEPVNRDLGNILSVVLASTLATVAGLVLGHFIGSETESHLQPGPVNYDCAKLEQENIMLREALVELRQTTSRLNDLGVSDKTVYKKPIKCSVDYEYTDISYLKSCPERYKRMSTCTGRNNMCSFEKKELFLKDFTDSIDIKNAPTYRSINKSEIVAKKKRKTDKYKFVMGGIRFTDEKSKLVSDNEGMNTNSANQNEKVSILQDSEISGHLGSTVDHKMNRIKTFTKDGESKNKINMKRKISKHKYDDVLYSNNSIGDGNVNHTLDSNRIVRENSDSIDNKFGNVNDIVTKISIALNHNNEVKSKRHKENSGKKKFGKENKDFLKMSNDEDKTSKSAYKLNQNLHKIHKKNKEEANFVDGIWLENIAISREKQRRSAHVSDWVFERAQGRDAIRDTARWYFNRMNGREIFRRTNNVAKPKPKTYRAQRYSNFNRKL